jgi:predicted SprT family Zn-dependent metalloprotease
MKRQTSPDSEIPPDLKPVVSYCADLWGVPALRERVRIIPSPWMAVTLAHAHPARNTISISTRALESGSDERIREVLCHELAHLASGMGHGRRVHPHGREWQELMRQTGYEPRVRFTRDTTLPLALRARLPLAFEHRCRSCGQMHLARTTNRHWRCPACLRAGREGRPTVTKLTDAGKGERRRVGRG